MCVIQNSVVIGDLTLAVEDRGRTVRFSCPSDYILIGNSTLPCSQLDLTAVEAFCVLSTSVDCIFVQQYLMLSMLMV